MGIRLVKFDLENEAHKVPAVMLYRAWKFRDPQNGLPLFRTHTMPERIESFIELGRLFEGLVKETPISDTRLQYELRREGFEVHLRQSTVDVLAEVWSAFKPFIDPELGVAVQTTDAFLKDLPLAPDIGDAVALVPKQRRALKGG